DAMLSDKHANFLINKKNASFDDAIFLIELAKKKVFEEFGIKLFATCSYKQGLFKLQKMF
ncbi:hypothetical protein VWM68_10360, partial [Campylobacter coli]